MYCAASSSTLPLCASQSNDGAIESRVDESNNHMTVLDAFCGVGGNTIAFARNSNVRVIAFDRDESRLHSASHNACIYGVRKAVRFAQCDAVSTMQDALLHRKLLENVDMIFLSPPWVVRNTSPSTLSTSVQFLSQAKACWMFLGTH